jgi:hypothetical protein
MEIIRDMLLTTLKRKKALPLLQHLPKVMRVTLAPILWVLSALVLTYHVMVLTVQNVQTVPHVMEGSSNNKEKKKKKKKKKLI